MPPAGSDRRSGPGGLLVYGLVLPFTLIVAGFSAWYMVTGETPLELKDRLTRGPRISLPMPGRPASGKPSDALLKPPAPPASAPAPVQTPPAGPAPVPAPPPASAPATDKPGAPQVTLPGALPAPPGVVPPPPAKAPSAPVSSFVAPPPPPPLEEPSTPPTGDSLAPPSYAQLPPLKEAGRPLPPAPLPELLRQTGAGALPIRAGGKEAWRAYARPVSAAQAKPGVKVAVVITGLGLSNEGTQAAINKLPPDISLSFSPYGANLAEWIRKARENGHEALLDLKLEPINFPQRDPGPLAVLASHSPGEALQRMDAMLGKAAGYVGVAATLHSPVEATDSWTLMLGELKDRGLLFIGDGLVGIDDKAMPAAGLVTLVADETPFRTAIDTELARALAAAKRDGSAIVTLSARPVSFERLLAFIASLPEKNVTLVPVSALVRPEP